MWNPYNPLSASTRNALGAASVVTGLLIWIALSGLDIVSPEKLPSPFETFAALIRLTWDGEHSALGWAILGSVGRVAIAGVLVFVVGLGAGFLMGASPHINAVFSPYIDPFRSAPVAALIPVLVMWLGIDELAKIAFLFLGAVVYMIPMVRDAIRDVPQTYWISAYDLGGTPFESVRKAVLPMAKPRIADAIIASVSIEWTYITVAEYMNAETGLGQIISDAQHAGAMNRVFATIFVIIALALVTYQVMTAIKKWRYPWAAE